MLCSNGSLTDVDNSGSSSYILSGLMAYMQYDVFLMPFYKMLLGKPSNLMTGYTDEDGKTLFIYRLMFKTSICPRNQAHYTTVQTTNIINTNSNLDQFYIELSLSHS